MSFFKKRPVKIISALLAVVLVCAIYLGNYYHADMEAVEAFAPVNAVEMRQDDAGNLVFGSEDAEAGFIFYPGGKVEHRAYIPLMKALASEDILCVLVEMPFRLAVLDVNAADGIRKQYPEIKNWYIGGHSLGGAMAASYASKHADDFEGLVLLGGYSTSDLTGTDLKVISVYGSRDRVMNRAKYEVGKMNLPKDSWQYVIEGGSHAYFGMYGLQKGDGEPTITNEEQIRQTAEIVAEFVKQ